MINTHQLADATLRYLMTDPDGIGSHTLAEKLGTSEQMLIMAVGHIKRDRRHFAWLREGSDGNRYTVFFDKDQQDDIRFFLDEGGFSALATDRYDKLKRLDALEKSQQENNEKAARLARNLNWQARITFILALAALIISLSRS